MFNKDRFISIVQEENERVTSGVRSQALQDIITIYKHTGSAPIDDKMLELAAKPVKFLETLLELVIDHESEALETLNQMEGLHETVRDRVLMTILPDEWDEAVDFATGKNSKHKN